MTITGSVSTSKAPVAVASVAKAAPAEKMNVTAASKMSVAVPPPLVRAGTVTPPETRSPTGRGRPEASVPAWPPGVLVAVNATVPKVSSSDDEASPRAASAAAAARLPPTPSVEKRELLAAVASPGAVYRTPELLYEPVKPSQLDAVRILDENPNRAAWLLLSLKPPRKALPQAPAPPRRAPKASSAPRPFAPSRFRRNHQAMSKPPQDADGNYPCAHKCGRVFGHAPAAVAHSKVPPASKSNIERLWKTIEAKRRGSLVDFNTGLQNETGGMATDFPLGGEARAAAESSQHADQDPVCIPQNQNPPPVRLKKKMGYPQHENRCTRRGDEALTEFI